jgi:hypothetical protein
MSLSERNRDFRLRPLAHPAAHAIIPRPTTATDPLVALRAAAPIQIDDVRLLLGYRA